MTPKEAATALFNAMPHPVTVEQMQEYGIDVTEAQSRQVAREILSLNLYWILAAVDVHILQKYRGVIGELLFDAVAAKWTAETFGLGAWAEYRRELDDRLGHYCKLMDDRLSPLALCAEAATILEDQRTVPADDRQKLLVLLIDYVPVDQYAALLDDTR